MKIKKIFLFSSVLLILITGCAVHNTPDSMTPNTASKNSINAFVDQNGTFYPDGWEEKYGTPCKYNCWRKHYSLLAIANSKGEQSISFLDTEKNRIINNIEDVLSKTDRIYILIHGYNNNTFEARGNYEKIKQLIDLGDRDTVIEFFWDGLVSESSIFGSAKIWFRATGYSQLAGSEGLRDILNASSNKEIFIISHSRGASVALSALSNPPYEKKFSDATLETHSVDVFDSLALANNNNRIKLLFLAPAIGDIDFQNPNDSSYRDLGDQLVGISYTVNPNDSILKKLINKPNVSGNFNPTEFGYNLKAGAPIKAHYGNIKSYDFSGTKSHKFGAYIKNKIFQTMLSEAGVRVK